jgi:hypothetical protein
VEKIVSSPTSVLPFGGWMLNRGSGSGTRSNARSTNAGSDSRSALDGSQGLPMENSVAPLANGKIVWSANPVGDSACETQLVLGMHSTSGTEAHDGSEGSDPASPPASS